METSLRQRYRKDNKCLNPFLHQTNCSLTNTYLDWNPIEARNKPQCPYNRRTVADLLNRTNRLSRTRPNDPKKSRKLIFGLHRIDKLPSKLSANGIRRFCNKHYHCRQPYKTLHSLQQKFAAKLIVSCDPHFTSYNPYFITNKK